MEQEALLLDQVETYIDRLVLLGMQEKIDHSQIKQTTFKIINLANNYLTLLTEKTETKLQGEESLFVSELEEELQKRKNMLSIIKEKREAFAKLFLNVMWDVEATASLKKYMTQQFESLDGEIHQYEDDVELVDAQIEAVKSAMEREEKLRDERTQAQINVNTLRNSQLSYSLLNDEVLASYQEILGKGNADSIDFSELRAKKEVLQKQQERYHINLALARKGKNTQEFIRGYEEKAHRNQKEIDEIEEQEFLHILKTWLEKIPVVSYETLQNRTKAIQDLAQSRIATVEKLYRNGVVAKGEYRTLAEQINHTKIFNQLRDLEVIQKNEESIASITEQLEDTRKDIKSVEELEAIFAQKAEERGRHAIIPEKVPLSQLVEDTQAEILSLEEPEKPKKEVVTVTPAPQGILAKALAVMKRLINKKPKYSPSIGDKIRLKDGVHIFSHPSEVFSGSNVQNNSIPSQYLYVTRGVIMLNQTKEVVYIGNDYGTDLEQIAQNMKLPSGSYHIVLGCSIGDENGKFIGVSEALNPKIEKGWVKASDPNIVVIEQLHQDLSKGVAK